jgi:type IV pilus secretin PilQ/predicted competence protein
MRLCDFKRLLVFGVLVVLLTLVVQAASPKDAAMVKDLAVTSSGETLEAKITSSETARFTYFELDAPRRLVVDFHGLKNGINFTQKKVETAGVAKIRTSYFSTPARKATRIVFDLAAGVNYQVVDDGGGVVRVLVGDPKLHVPVADQIPSNLLAGQPVFVTTEEETTAALTRASLVSLAAAQEAPAATSVVLLEPQVISQPLTAAAAVVAAPAPVRAAAPAPAPPPALVQVTGQITTGTPSTVPVIITPPTPQTFNGELISLDLVDTNLKDFFRLIADISGLNIFLDENVTGTLTVTLKEVPWDQALDIVLKYKNLGGVYQGNVLRIATAATLASEQAAVNAVRTAAAAATPLANKTYVMNYTKAADVSTVLKASGVLSTRGNVTPEPRRNALIVSDLEAQFPNIDRMVAFIDVPAQQVEIEARLLTANKSFSREFGSQLGLIVGNNSGNIITGGQGQGSPFNRDPEPRAVIEGAGIPLLSNLPAAATSGIAFLMQPGSDILLDAIISAAEAKGTARLMSRPHVVTQNNIPAEISQGTQIPVQTNVNNTISVSFLTFALKLNVTPQITEAGTILLTVEIENSQPDFARSVNGVPSVSTQAAKTQTLVADGTTMMIGGIYVDTDSLNIRQVPGLGSIPIIGNLFKNTSTIKSTAELLFFITPRIRASDPVIAAPAN